jgi:hypothetical protein
MPGGNWSSGTERLVGQGFDAVDPSRNGLYSRRTSDGAGLIRITNPGSRIDWPVSASPQDALVDNTDGADLTR